MASSSSKRPHNRVEDSIAQSQQRESGEKALGDEAVRKCIAVKEVPKLCRLCEGKISVSGHTSAGFGCHRLKIDEAIRHLEEWKKKLSAAGASLSLIVCVGAIYREDAVSSIDGFSSLQDLGATREEMDAALLQLERWKRHLPDKVP